MKKILFKHSYLRLIALGGWGLCVADVAFAQSGAGLSSRNFQYQNRSAYEVPGGSPLTGLDGALNNDAQKVDVSGSVEVIAIHEDNVYLDGSKPEDDTYFVILPGVRVRYGSRADNSFYVGYNTEIPLGQSEDSDTINNHIITTRGNWAKGKSSANAGYNYSNIRQSDLLLGNRVTKEGHTAQAGYKLTTSRKTALGLNGSYTLNDYDDSTYVDSNTTQVGGRVYWTHSRKTSIYLELAYGWVDVEARDEDFGDAEYYQTTLGTQWKVSDNWNLSGSLGYQDRTYTNDDLIDDGSYVVGSLQLSGLLYERVQGHLGASSRVQPTANETGGSVNEQRVEAGVSRRLFTDDLVLSLDGSIGWSDYDTPDIQEERGEIGTEQVFDDRSDEFWGFAVNLDWQINDDFDAGVSYSYVENETNRKNGNDSTSYDAQRWMLRGRYSF